MDPMSERESRQIGVTFAYFQVSVFTIVAFCEAAKSVPLTELLNVVTYRNIIPQPRCSHVEQNKEGDLVYIRSMEQNAIVQPDDRTSTTANSTELHDKATC